MIWQGLRGPKHLLVFILDMEIGLPSSGGVSWLNSVDSALLFTSAWLVAFSSHGRRRPRKERQIRTKISLKIIVVMMIVVMVMRKRRISSKTPLRIMRLTKKKDARYTKITHKLPWTSFTQRLPWTSCTWRSHPRHREGHPHSGLQQKPLRSTSYKLTSKFSSKPN